jgi:hypothetical protein
MSHDLLPESEWNDQRVLNHPTKYQPFPTSRALWRVPPTGRRIEVPLVGIFDFDCDLLMCVKVYFDLATLIRRLQA